MLTNCGCREISREPIEFKIQDCPQQVHTDCGPLLPNTNEKDWCKLKNKIIYDFQKVVKQLECGIQPDIELILEEISLIFMNSCGYNVAKKMYATDLEEDYFLRHNNFLSEFETQEEKDQVLINLGIYDTIQNIITRDELNNTVENAVSQVNITIDNKIAEVNDIVEELNNKLDTKVGFVAKIDKMYYAFASNESYLQWLRNGANFDSNLILAKWVASNYIPSTFIVRFNTVGGNLLDPQTVTEEYSIQLPVPTWIDNTKTFDGWYDNPQYNGTKYTGRYTPTDNIILYAKWKDSYKYKLTTSIPLQEPIFDNSFTIQIQFGNLEGWSNWQGQSDQYIILPKQAGKSSITDYIDILDQYNQSIIEDFEIIDSNIENIVIIKQNGFSPLDDSDANAILIFKL